MVFEELEELLSLKPGAPEHESQFAGARMTIENDGIVWFNNDLFVASYEGLYGQPRTSWLKAGKVK